MDPPLCANGCGFFGTSSTGNLCSKCYRDFLKEELEEANLSAKIAIASMEKPTTTASSSSSVVDLSSPSSLFSENNNINSTDHVASVSTATKKRRCQSCKKRVGLLGFDCRCGGVFCGAHRYAEEHSCSFDFKAFGREALAKANPLCKSDKLQEKI